MVRADNLAGYDCARSSEVLEMLRVHRCNAFACLEELFRLLGNFEILAENFFPGYLHPLSLLPIFPRRAPAFNVNRRIRALGRYRCRLIECYGWS